MMVIDTAIKRYERKQWRQRKKEWRALQRVIGRAAMRRVNVVEDVHVSSGTVFWLEGLRFTYFRDVINVWSQRDNQWWPVYNMVTLGRLLVEKRVTPSEE